MNIVLGDLLKAKENIIVHQVNCQGVMGSGLALSIRKKYPNVYEEYRNYCVRNVSDKLLGRCLLVRIKPNKYVCNLFGQFSYGRTATHTNYSAFRKALKLLAKLANEKDYSVAFPFKIGSNLAGGDWNIIKQIIEEEMKGIEYTVYKKIG